MVFGIDSKLTHQHSGNHSGAYFCHRGGAMNQFGLLSDNTMGYFGKLSVLVSALFLSTATFAFDSGSSGADGALNPTVDTEIPLPPSGVLNYTTVNIPPGVTVTFRKNAANTPVYILASGDITVAGTLSVKGEDGRDVGAYGDGLIGDDGLPGKGGPGGFDGGRGGRKDAALKPEIIRGGAGLGPGGGLGGIEGNDGCNADKTRYHQYSGVGGGYGVDVYAPRVQNYCGGPSLSKAYGSELLQPLIGGSGGGGGRGGSVYAGSGGGGGGGALLLAASGMLTVSGMIEASGGDSGGQPVSSLSSGYGAQGSGGSGGGIRLLATSIAGKGVLYARGGCLKSGNQGRQYCGWDGSYYAYGGSPGRIRLEGESITFTGTVDPLPVTDQPKSVFMSELPGLRIASVAGKPVPVNPSGYADVTLPADTVGPIEITFQSTNIPTGHPVVLRVSPAYGERVEVQSAELSGSTAAGSTSVSVTLPKGPSTLQATVRYTIVVAGLLDLSRFAQNEAVEKVHVTVALAGETRVMLETVNGRQIEVPYDTLRAAGFQG